MAGYRFLRLGIVALGVAGVLTVSAGCASRSAPTLAYIDKEGNLALRDVPGKRPERITEDGKVFWLGWSPSGDWLAYVVRHDDADGGGVFLYQPASGRRVALQVREDWALCSVTWSPDENYLAVDSGTAACGRTLEILALADAAAGRWVAVGTVPYCLSFLWSPKGGCIVAGVEEPANPPLPTEGGNTVSVAVVTVPTLERRVVVRGTREWLCSPVEWRGEETLVYVMKPAEPGPGKDIMLMALNPFVDSPVPLPVEAGRVPTWRMELLAKLPEELRGSVGEFSTSSDGRFMAFSAMEDGVRHVYVVDVQTGDKVRAIAEGSCPVLRPRSQ